MAGGALAAGDHESGQGRAQHGERLGRSREMSRHRLVFGGPGKKGVFPSASL